MIDVLDPVDKYGGIAILLDARRYLNEIQLFASLRRGIAGVQISWRPKYFRDDVGAPT